MDTPATNKVQRYIIPAGQLPGNKKLYFSVIGDVPLGDNQAVLLHYTNNQPYATLYTYEDMADLLPFLQVEQNAKIHVFKDIEDEDTESSSTDPEAPKEGAGDKADVPQN